MTAQPRQRWIGLAAALALLNASLTFQSLWPTPAITWHGELSIELAVLVLLVTVLSRWLRPPGRLAVRVVSALWVLVVVSRYAQVTAPALYGRDINLYWDLQHVSGVVAMLSRAASWGVVLLVLLVAALGMAAIYAAARWTLGRVAAALAEKGERRGLLVLGGLVCVLFAAQRPSVELLRLPAFATPVLGTYIAQIQLVGDAWAAHAGATLLPASPALDSDLARVRGADVLLIFLESYGAVSDDRADFAQRLSASRQGLADAIRDTNRDVVSAYVESPTFGGSSWLAHISLLSGVEVRDPDTNARLMAERRDTLVTTFSRGGYRTVAIMPGLQQAWPEGAFYGFDEIYRTTQHGYQGPPFGWWAIPESYAFAMLDARELKRASRPPVFAFFPTVTTHAPFSPTPPYQPDWERMLTTAPFEESDLEQAYATEPDWLNLGPSYVNTLTYAFTVIGGFLRERADRDLVMVLLGDHQPLAAVSGEGARWDVPVHVIAGRSDVLERLKARGFRAGLAPARPALGKMHAMLPVLLEAFGALAGPEASSRQ